MDRFLHTLAQLASGNNEALSRERLNHDNGNYDLSDTSKLYAYPDTEFSWYGFKPSRLAAATDLMIDYGNGTYNWSPQAMEKYGINEDSILLQSPEKQDAVLMEFLKGQLERYIADGHSVEDYIRGQTTVTLQDGTTVTHQNTVESLAAILTLYPETVDGQGNTVELYGYRLHNTLMNDHTKNSMTKMLEATGAMPTLPIAFNGSAPDGVTPVLSYGPAMELPEPVAEPAPEPSLTVFTTTPIIEQHTAEKVERQGEQIRVETGNQPLAIAMGTPDTPPENPAEFRDWMEKKMYQAYVLSYTDRTGAQDIAVTINDALWKYNTLAAAEGSKLPEIKYEDYALTVEGLPKGLKLGPLTDALARRNDIATTLAQSDPDLPQPVLEASGFMTQSPSAEAVAQNANINDLQVAKVIPDLYANAETRDQALSMVTQLYLEREKREDILPGSVTPFAPELKAELNQLYLIAQDREQDHRVAALFNNEATQAEAIALAVQVNNERALRWQNDPETVRAYIDTKEGQVVELLAMSAVAAATPGQQELQEQHLQAANEILRGPSDRQLAEATQGLASVKLAPESPYSGYDPTQFSTTPNRQRGADFSMPL
jgi:hypothetical protein